MKEICIVPGTALIANRGEIAADESPYSSHLARFGELGKAMAPGESLIIIEI